MGRDYPNFKVNILWNVITVPNVKYAKHSRTITDKWSFISM